MTKKQKLYSGEKTVFVINDVGKTALPQTMNETWPIAYNIHKN